MHDNLATVRAVYAAFGSGDIPAILARMHPDILWEPDTTDHGIPWIRPGRGHAAAGAFFTALATLEFHAFSPEAFLADDHHVAVFVRNDVTNRATGRRFADVEMHYWTFDAEGRIVAMKHFVDTVKHRAAATATPPAP